MNLPPNFPLTEQQITNIGNRLNGVSGYAGVGVAGPMRDLDKVYRALLWVLARYEGYISQYQTQRAKAEALTTYMQAAEPVLQAYAIGNWDGGAAANQLIQNMPQIP